MSKKRKVEATDAERRMMEKADAMASAIDNKPTVVEEEATVVEPQQKPVGVTVVEGAPAYGVGEQKTTVFTPEQVKSYGTGDALLNTLNSAPKSGEIILDSVYNDPNSTAEDLQNVKPLAKVANQEEEKEKANIESQIYSGPGASNVNLAPNATSSTLTNIGEQQGKPSFATTGTKEDVSKGMEEQYKKEAESIPAVVIEKLGVQDYYPQIGRDVAVGTFTGSRIGSQTIYSGAGVLLPQGLYDARKRALASAAQEKQKKIEEYLKIGDTLPQFNREYKNYAYNTLVKYAEKHNYNPNALFKDRDFMNEKYRLETLGKEIEYVGGIADNVFEKYQSKDGKPGSFVPDDVMKAAIDFRSGVADMDAILSGKSSVLDVGKRLKTYTNGTTWADSRLSEWKSKPTELPINLKNQEKMTIEDLNKIQDEIKKVKISGDHDSYVTAISKHYKLDPQVIDSWIAMNMPGASDKDKEFVSENLNKYILSQMPDDSIETKIESLNNKNFDYAKLAQQNRQWAAEFQQKKEQGKGYWDVVNESMNFVDQKSGKPITQLIQGWKNQKLSASQIQNKMLETARNNGIRNAYIDKYTKAVTISMRPSDKEADAFQSVNIPEAKLFIQERTWSNKSKKWVYNQKPITYKEFLNIKDFKTKDGKSKYLFPNNQKITSETIREYRDASRGNKIFLRANEIQASYGLMNDKTKNIETLNSSNIDQFSPNKAVNLKRTVGVPYAQIPLYDEKGKQKINPETNKPMYEYKALPGTMFFNNQISTASGREPLNMIHGTDYEPVGFGIEYETVGEGSYSGGSSSDEE